MRFSFTEEQKALRDEIRAFFKKECADDVVERLRAENDFNTDFSRSLHKKMAAKGWLAMGWPKEYGGKGWSSMEMGIFNEEAAYYRAPMKAFGVTSIAGNSIIHMGTPEHKKKYLPGLASGDLLYCIGYTEPNAGSDLAALETKAVEDGDEYVINGVKIFNTAGQLADHCWLAARTDQQAPKHKGISVFMVDMKSPGLTVRPLHHVGGHHLNELSFEDVRVPRENMVGEKNRGWYVIAKALDIERSGTASVGTARRALDDLIEFCRETKRNGVPLSKDPVVRQHIAQLTIETEVARMLAYELAWQQSEGKIPDVLASMSKLYGTELNQKVAHLGLQIMGMRGLVQRDDKWAVMKGHLELMVRESISNTIEAGSSEIQRGIIALRGLGLPRA